MLSNFRFYAFGEERAELNSEDLDLRIYILTLIYGYELDQKKEITDRRGWNEFPS